MRILFISNLYPPYELGGWEQQCQEVVKCLLTRGHDCHVLTSRYGLKGRPSSEPGVTRGLYLEADIYHYRPLDFFLRRPWQERANRRVLRRVLDAFQPDVVFIWGMWNLSQRVPHWAEQWMPGRVVYNIESYWPMEPDPHRQYWLRAGRRRLARAISWLFGRLALAFLTLEHYPPRLQFLHVSCCSQYVADQLTEAKVIPPGAVVILNGIDPLPFLGSQRKLDRDGQLRLLYFGGLIPQKGVHTAIEALGVLRACGKANNLQLTVVGGGQPEYEVYLHRLVRDLGLKDKVRFVGRVPRSEIPKVLANHDIFLFTSVWAEPFGRTIIEAMAAGLAVIGADVGGSREIFQFYPGGTTYPPGDALALAHQIERFIDAPDLVQSLGQAGQSLVLQRFTLDRMVDEIENWLREVVG